MAESNDLKTTDAPTDDLTEVPADALPTTAEAKENRQDKVDPKILAQFKYRLTGKKKQMLKSKYPIISGYILEHYLKYGKPPFRNFGYLRNVKICRYGD